MVKGSQLSQLKLALSQAGINGHHGKKKKPSRSAEYDKVKRAAKLREIQQKLNPFDVKVTKLKHDVGGRKIKGASGRPAQSKQAGMQQREKTLLKELEARGRVGGVVDRRFGENDPSMSLEERMLERFTKERQRSSKGSAFNLDDEEELTHYGQSLSNLDDFDDIVMDDDEEEEEGQLDRETVKRAHFGGFGDDEGEKTSTYPDRKKSKAEVMAEVIAKSKEHKMRRQMEKEQEENMRHQLDHDFDSLRTLLYAPDPSSTDSNYIPPSGVPIVPLKPANDEDTVDYDKQVRELAFDKRAKPKDRTKTEEELALEQKEALEKAERKRRIRMLGQETDESDDERAGGRKRKRVRGGDDLDDDFMEEEAPWWTWSGTRRRGWWRGDEDGVSDIVDDDGLSSDEASEEEEGGFTEMTTKPRTTRPPKISEPSQELPYTFSAPETHEEFLQVVDNVRDGDVPTVVQRIRTLYHHSLAPENKFKLQDLTRVLIDHILYITSPPTPRMTLLSALVPHLFSLSRSYPIESAECFVEKLSLMHKNLTRGLAAGPLEPTSRTWPGLSELTLLRVIGIIWPTSDMHHPVVSPARLLMGAYLGLCRVRSLADATSGLFLSSLFLQYESLSKRFVPEAVNFVVNAALHLAPHAFASTSSLPGAFPCPDFRSRHCEPLAINKKAARGLVFRKPNLQQLMSTQPTEQSKIDALGLSLDLIDRFVDLYEPIHLVLSGLECGELSENVQCARYSALLQSPHKPIPIPSYIPKFESSSSSYLRRQDPDRERNEASKLRYQLKQERKGAIRELRKDAKFLAAAEHKKQAEKDRAYKERMNKVSSTLEGERAEQKAMEREKAKEKRRAGRK
ncbi:nucleolar protein 14 [Melanogaster broomeanus]|nr:nucleolar protein 14 [Melanogaster broomeanus]